MKINHNLSAITANNQLLKTEDSLSGVMERLSSGLKLNHAKDNPAGMAISNKMQTQINGLNRANNNATDGQAVIEIADGALNEVTEMIQRMRELCVQAANDTNCDDDRAAIQSEIAELKEEINRVSEDTEYNTMRLLDGSQCSRVYSDQVGRLSVSRYVDEGTYKFKVNTPAEQAKWPAAGPYPAANAGANGEYTGESGSISINGYVVSINKGDSAETVYEKMRSGAEKGECTIAGMGQPLNLTSVAYGKDAEITISGSADVLAYLHMAETPQPTTAVGKDADVTLEKTTPTPPASYTPFSDKATVRQEGNHFIISDAGGFEISCYAYDETAGAPVTGDVSIEVTDIGNMTLQIGANQHQTLDVEIPAITCEMMYIDDLDCTTITGADRGIGALDGALNYVSTARARLGAYENRLDHTIADLSTSAENMTKALSSLSDADMAEEMVDYTTYNVLQQAGVSVLTQANDLPQTVLQLLG